MLLPEWYNFFPKQVLWLAHDREQADKLTVASSEQEAITKSLKGFHLMSSTFPLCPHTRG